MKREHDELAQDTADLTQVSREEGSRLKGPDAYRNKTILAPMVRVVRLPCPGGWILFGGVNSKPRAGYLAHAPAGPGVRCRYRLLRGDHCQEVRQVPANC